MLDNPKVGDRVAFFSQWNQKVPNQILIIEKVGKASIWTMDGQRWDLLSGARHGRDKWSAAEIRSILDGDEERWNSARERVAMELDLQKAADIARHMPTEQLRAIVDVIRSTAPGATK